MQTLRQLKRLLPLSNDESFPFVHSVTISTFFVSQMGQNKQYALGENAGYFCSS
jgi:hypothetical protein